MSKLTTHVLDTAHGKPAIGMEIELWRHRSGGEPPELIKTVLTNDDGRVDAPLMANETLHEGTFELRFGVGDYFDGIGHADAKAFLDVVPIVFTIIDAEAHYHVPLLVSPWAYSTYRGS